MREPRAGCGATVRFTYRCIRANGAPGAAADAGAPPSPSSLAGPLVVGPG
jgi:hypothetical protein